MLEVLVSLRNVDAPIVTAIIFEVCLKYVNMLLWLY